MWYCNTHKPHCPLSRNRKGDERSVWWRPVTADLSCGITTYFFSLFTVFFFVTSSSHSVFECAASWIRRLKCWEAKLSSKHQIKCRKYPVLVCVSSRFIASSIIEPAPLVEVITKPRKVQQVRVWISPFMSFFIPLHISSSQLLSFLGAPDKGEIY